MIDRFKLHSIRDILKFPKPQWRVSGLLPVGAFTMVYAPQEQGKSFFALDLALSIASGQEFHGRRVKQGPVVYVLGEGRGGLRKRITAWLCEHRVADVEDAFFVIEAVQFRREDDAEALRAQIDALGVTPALVVIDTFARCAVGVKENDATEVGEWIDAIRELQDELAVDVLALHHATKARGKNEPPERGSSAFIGATDTAIRLKRSGHAVTVVCKKQKEAEHFEQFTLQMKVVPVGFDDDGAPMDSCVLVSGNEPNPADELSQTHRVMLVALRAAPNQRLQRDAWLAEMNLPERTFDRRRDELFRWKCIDACSERGVYAITEKGLVAIANESPTNSHGEAALLVAATTHPLRGGVATEAGRTS